VFFIASTCGSLRYRHLVGKGGIVAADLQVSKISVELAMDTSFLLARRRAMPAQGIIEGRHQGGRWVLDSFTLCERLTRRIKAPPEGISRERGQVHLTEKDAHNAECVSPLN